MQTKSFYDKDGPDRARPTATARTDRPRDRSIHFIGELHPHSGCSDCFSTPNRKKAGADLITRITG